MKSGLTLLIVFLVAYSAEAFSQMQVCVTNKQATTPVTHFDDKGNGTVVDNLTKKIWQRCAVGLQWDGQSCTGKSQTFTYAEVLAEIDTYNKEKYAHRNNWRLPTRDELLSIVEQRCYNPAINLDVFPYSPQSGFWTATENAGLLSMRQEIVHFLNGGVYVSNKNQAWRARLIAD